MKVTHERKLVTIEVSDKEMEILEELEFSNIGSFGDIFIDLDTYNEYFEENINIINSAIRELKNKHIKADIIQFITIL